MNPTGGRVVQEKRWRGQLVTAKEASQQLGVTELVIRQWVFREYLAPAVRGKRPHLFYLEDVDKCLTTRQMAAASRVAPTTTGPVTL